jgi:crotonobetainyl-CoA:carnitine CoA-transferase CaiB-like acyl-CoA transferase
MTKAKGALSHLKVLDLSRILAGPWAGQTLADLGADVIKVEKPGAGDDTRAWGPPWLPDRDGNPTGDAAYYLAANRNKRSITVDFTRSEGQEIVRKLAADSDILIENYKFGGLAKYGLDYASLSAINPRLIYCSITGFGQTGPYAPRPGYDLLLQAMGGLMSITGDPSTPPQRVGVAVVDLMSGLYSTIGILAALAAREQTGRGQQIDIALLDVEVACLANQGMNYLITGTSPVQSGNAHPNIVPYQDFPTSDGAMIVAVGNDGQFARFANVLGAPEWADDQRYATNGARVINRAGFVAMIAARTAARTTKDWVALLEAANVPCGPINRIGDVFADSQVQSRGMRIALDHPVGGEIPSIASPLRLSETPVSYDRAPPVLGQHTAEVLADRLGMDAAAIAALSGLGVV